MKRGDVVTIALQGDLGKPRPAVVLQSDLFNETHPSVVVLPRTSVIEPAPLIRLTVEPSVANGLLMVSQVMIDKPTTVRRDKIGKVGRLDEDVMLRIGRAMVVWLGLA